MSGKVGRELVQLMQKSQNQIDSREAREERARGLHEEQLKRKVAQLQARAERGREQCKSTFP